MTPYGRALAVWVIIMCVETIHGIARGLLLVPMTGDLAARQIGVVVGSLLIFVIALATVNWLRTTSLQQRLVIGITWVFLTVIFEFLLGYCVMELTIDRILSDYHILHGGFMIFGLLIMAVSPAAAFALRNCKADA